MHIILSAVHVFYKSILYLRVYTVKTVKISYIVLIIDTIWLSQNKQIILSSQWKS